MIDGWSNIGEIIKGMEAEGRGDFNGRMKKILENAKRRNEKRREEGYRSPYAPVLQEQEYICPRCKHKVSIDSPGYIGYDHVNKRAIPCPECYPVFQVRRERRIADKHIEDMVMFAKFPNMQNIPIGKENLRMHTYPSQGDKRALSYFDAFVKGRVKELFVTGEPGVGKTGLAISAVQELAAQDVQVLFMPMNEYINLLLENNRDGAVNNHIKDIAKFVEVLVLDDMGVERSTDSGNTLRETQELIEFRHDTNRRTLITSNLTVEGLAQHWHSSKGDRTGFQDAKRLVSRLTGAYKFITMTGPDLRQGGKR